MPLPTYIPTSSIGGLPFLHTLSSIFKKQYFLTDAYLLNIFSTDYHLNSNTCKVWALGFSGGLVVNNLPANVEDTGLIPCLGRSHMPWGS